MDIMTRFQSTRPIRGATTYRRTAKYYCKISIHAPHTGRDLVSHSTAETMTEISIHAPHTGRDLAREALTMVDAIFQSTRPIRGATCPRVDFLILFLLISIHAPHTGRDGKATSGKRRKKYFNPRAPYGARRITVSPTCWAFLISIHAPHTGRDASPSAVVSLS